MIENNESGDEYIIGTVILAQEIKLARQRRRIAQLEAAILQLRENAVLASVRPHDCGRPVNKLTFKPRPAPRGLRTALCPPTRAPPLRRHPSVTRPLTFES